jgi:hypothetical protein
MAFSGSEEGRLRSTIETKLPGRDHWGAVQTVFFAGGGVRGGTVIGESDAIGGHPKSDPQTPENMAATIYEALGQPRALAWKDSLDCPITSITAIPSLDLIRSAAFSLLLSGGGFKAGHIHGATDEFGYKSVEQQVSVPDLHATILHHLGIDHTRLTSVARNA